MSHFLKVLKSEDGQGMVEYGLIIGFLAVVIITAIALLGDKITALINSIDITP